jgi:hypothetical protein
MKRGFIFSLDAALALIVVMAMGTMLVLYFQATETRGQAFAASELNASDSAVVGFYLNKSPAEMGLTEEIPGSADFGSCAVWYEYGEIQVNGGRADVVEKSYCRVM